MKYLGITSIQPYQFEHSPTYLTVLPALSPHVEYLFLQLLNNLAAEITASIKDPGIITFDI